MIILSIVEDARDRLKVWLWQYHHWEMQHDVSYYLVEEAPSTLDELRDAVEYSHERCLIPVSSENQARTIYGDGAIGAEHNSMFRAIHDYLHLQLGAEFTLAGELEVVAVHLKSAERYFGEDSLELAMLYADTVGQTQYFAERGEFPPCQLEFVLQHPLVQRRIEEL